MAALVTSAISHSRNKTALRLRPTTRCRDHRQAGALADKMDLRSRPPANSRNGRARTRSTKRRNIG
jgi:hypothetical protein